MFYIQTIKDLEKRVAALEAAQKPVALKQPLKLVEHGGLAKAIDLVMADGSTHTNRSVYSALRKQGLKVNRDSIYAYMSASASKFGKYERVGHGVYKAKRKA